MIGPIAVDNLAAQFICKPVNRASESMMSPKSDSIGSDLKLFNLFGWDQSSFVCCLGHRGLPDFGVRVSVTFHLTCVHVIFSSV